MGGHYRTIVTNPTGPGYLQIDQDAPIEPSTEDYLRRSEIFLYQKVAPSSRFKIDFTKETLDKKIFQESLQKIIDRHVDRANQEDMNLPE